MATRSGYVGTEAIGDVLTKANFDKGPGGLIGYANITTNAGAVGPTLTAIGGLTIAPGGINIGRIYQITVGVAGVTTSTGANSYDLCILDVTGASSIASNIIVPGSTAASGSYGGGSVSWVQNGVTAGQQWAAAWFNSGGTAIALATASGSARRTSWIQVADVGPSF